MSERELIAMGRELADLGYCPGGTGNVSWRDQDDVVITRSGVDLYKLAAHDLVRCKVDWSTRRVREVAPGASKELPLHLAMHARVPDQQGFVGHVHSASGVSVSCLPAFSGKTAIPPLTPYFVMKVGEVPLIKYAVPGSQPQADAMFASESAAHTMLLQNHGLVSWAIRTEQLIDRIRESELTAATWLQLRAFENVNLLSENEQAELRNAYPQ
ncbi:MAG: aldolase [Leucobacter sp.]|nr:aldolase [Leucobacter sp.]